MIEYKWWIEFQRAGMKFIDDQVQMQLHDEKKTSEGYCKVGPNSIVRLVYNIKLIYMRFRERDQSSKRAYSRISLKKRKLLVKWVLEQGLSISVVIKKLNLKLTTARLILQKYKQTGTFPMRKFRKCSKMLQDLSSSEQISVAKKEILEKPEQEQPEPKIQSPIQPIIKVEPTQGEQSTPNWPFHWYPFANPHWNSF